jgi:hypothetical protein
MQKNRIDFIINTTAPLKKQGKHKPFYNKKDCP